MPVSKPLGTIFIHIPKNAGESVERTLGMYAGDPAETFWGVIENRYALQHLTALELRDRLLPNMWDTYFKFAIVRNPWSRAVSEYKWYLRFGPVITFFEWVESLEQRLKINHAINIYEVGHNIEQYKFLYDAEGKILVDKILRFEYLQSEFSDLCAVRGWTFELQYAQTTATPDQIEFQRYYDEASVLKIYKIYEKDINLLGYDADSTFSGFNIGTDPVGLDAFFDHGTYLALNPDVKEAGLDPYQHYLEYGIKEGRRIRS